MAVELYDLIKEVNNMDITLLAGKKGIHNLVTWIHMIETIEAADFLNTSEVVITTGFALNRKDSLLELTKSLYNNKASGLIINAGPFIEKVPENVLSFADKNDFPVFIVPWKVHLSEIIRIFSVIILKDEQKNLEISAAFKNAIFFPKQEELYVVQLSQRGFHVNWNYTVCTLSIVNSNTKRLLSLVVSLEKHMKHEYSHFSIFLYESEIVIIIANYTDSKIHTFINELLEYLKPLLRDKENFYIGIGKQTKSIRCLYKSFNQAKSIQKLQSKNKIDKSLIFYSDMGIFKLLMSIDDKEIVHDYYDYIIGPIKEYDSKNNSSLVPVLRSYLKHNGSVKETSDELFIHRNTVNYKINKIEELLGMDLSLLDTRIQLMVGFMLQDMM